ncbi:sensor histidine kinase [Fibrella sp. WM1]|uniref:sensor histidine kinase n=1 Tax=Fibrella musci TaxID=3242485 RepID=UPI003520D8D1
MPPLLTYLSRFFNTIRHDPLRRYIYLLLWPWFIPVVSYLIFGEALLAGWRPFVSGVVVVLLLSTLANEVDTAALIRIIHRFPGFDQTIWRLVSMVAAFSLLNCLLAEVSLRVFEVTHFLGYRANADTHKWTQAFVFISGVVAAGLIESAYAFTQWRTHQSDRQSLEQDNLRIQLDSLRSRINPHFLFNSLNSVSSLIADDPKQAEALVDELSKVYRYMLQANQKPLVELSAEVRFIQSYARLLEARYGAALQLHIDIHPAASGLLLPSLSLQLLLDHICQHNALTAARPLTIQIETSGGGRLWVRHSRQPRTILIDRQLPGLDAIAARYDWLGSEQILVDETDRQITIALPLLPADTSPPPLSTVQAADLPIE